MVLGVASRLDVGGDDVVGAAWGAKDMLLVTTSHAVRVFKVSTQSCARSWIARPGVSMRFSSACVRCNADSSLYCIRAQKSLVSWKWSEENLASSQVHDLPSPGFALHSATNGNSAIVVCTDGTVCAFTGSRMVTSVAPSEELPPVVWSHVTKLASGPGTGSTSVVLTLHGHGSSTAGPILNVVQVVVRARGGDKKVTASSTNLVRHTLPALNSAGSTPTDVVSAAYHPHLQRLSVFWASGAWQELQFSDAGLLTTPASTVAHTLRVGVAQSSSTARGSKKSSRRRARAASTTPSGPTFTASGIDRHGVVVAGCTAADDNNTPQIVLWDALFGAVVSSTPLPVPQGDAVDDGTTTRRLVGVFPAPDWSNLVVASTSAVHLLPVANRGSLAAAMGRGVSSAGTAAGAADVVPAPIVDVRTCLPQPVLATAAAAAAAGTDGTAVAADARPAKKRRRANKKGASGANGAGVGAGAGASAGAGAGAGASAGAGANGVPSATSGVNAGRGGSLPAEQLAAWQSTTARETEVEARVIADLSTKSVTPNARAFKRVFDAYVARHTTAFDPTGMDEAASNKARKAGKKKRKRQATEAAVDAASAPAVTYFSPSFAFLKAVASRVVEAPRMNLWAPLQTLLGTRQLSASTEPRLLPFVMKRQQLDVLETCLTHLSDVSETSLAQVVRFVVAEVDAKHMQTFVAAKFEAAGADTPKEDAAVMAGVEHFLCLIFRTRVNDVLMQAALSKLSPSEALAVLVALKRLLKSYWIEYLDMPVSGTPPSEKTREFAGAAPSTPVPTLQQALEWTQMVIDAQFLNLAVEAQKKPFVHDLLKSVNEVVKQHTSLAKQVSHAGIPGALAHMLNHGKAMPVNPTPDYSIETLTL